MVPAKRVALDKEHCEERKDNERDDLLDNLELPQCKGTSKLGTTDAISWHLKAVLEECYAPADEDDGDNAVTLQLRLKGYMSIPRERHKDVRADKQCYSRYSLNKHIITISKSVLRGKGNEK